MQERKKMRNAIALMITLFFVMALTVSIGLGLKYVKEGAQSVNQEQFLIQIRSVLADFLTMLRKTPQITSINSADTLSLFLSQASLIPLSNNDMSVIIQMGSARDKISPEILNTKVKRDAFLAFLARNGINPDYLNILDDLMGGIKVDGSYKSDIFTNRPTLFRNYIASKQQLEVADTFYIEQFHEQSLQKITPTKLFYTSAESNASNYKMDLNHIKPMVWEILLGCDKQRAETLSANGGYYTNENDLGLSEDENLSLMRFHQNISFYEPFIAIKITIIKDDEQAIISFEYNLQSKKGSNFVLEV